jgi:nitrogen regulatory protein PII
MKLIIAVIRAEKLLEVDRTIGQPGVVLTCVGPVLDAHDPQTSLYRRHWSRDPRSRVRLEVVVLNETLVQEILGRIVRAASAHDTWRQGSGHVLVVPLDDSPGLDPGHRSAA